ncbi:XrtA/PEP-CTERM system histidine kinase PrsK [Sphingomonas qilianensis]|uniref:histidine kinase n=1 Tax=Sphingomonas qilianensis TaxID=1736690 RepID=A0ABU9XPL6_9SPHN
MALTVTLWGYSLAALLFCMIALSQVRDASTALPRWSFVVALVGTALWALAVAGIDANDIAARVTEGIRNVAWLWFMHALLRRQPAVPQARAITAVYIAVVLTLCLAIIVPIVPATRPGEAATLAWVSVLFGMIVAVSALVLVEHLYATVAPAARGGIRLLVIALAAMWGMDLVVYAITYVTHGTVVDLIAVRGVMMALLAPLFAVAVLRNGDWTLHLSRSVAWLSLSLAAVVLYLLTMMLATSALAGIGANARIVQTAFVFGSTAAMLVLASSPWLKAWAKVVLAKHLFSHRYDYREEWIRFTGTLGKAGGDVALALDQRVIKAIADLTDSPAGLLLVPEGQGLGIGAAWQWEHDTVSLAATDEALLLGLATSSRIIELDAVRGGAETMVTPPTWMLLDTNAWVIVPLVYFDRLQGAVLLARPPVDRALDWEDFDLLRIVGRQAASFLAEGQAQEALAESARFDEFNRRFAFILHDIKNLVSQLTLTARNAERHADNPAYRADMIATLHDSAGRMNDLLARLSQHHTGRTEEPRPTELRPLAERVARRIAHPIDVRGAAISALVDPARLEQLLVHLMQNASEASAPDARVTITLDNEDGRPVVAVMDTGAGMSPAFVRDRLFKPFVSSKPGGFGLGAFEARQLAEAMGGTITVTSREGEGSIFRVRLAPVAAHHLERAA